MSIGLLKNNLYFCTVNSLENGEVEGIYRDGQTTRPN